MIKLDFEKKNWWLILNIIGCTVLGIEFIWFPESISKIVLIAIGIYFLIEVLTCTFILVIKELDRRAEKKLKALRKEYERRKQEAESIY